MIKKCLKNTTFTMLSLVSLALSGCDNAPLEVLDRTKTHYQAIDGYIVNGSVSCDGIDNGVTGAAGLFTCPGGTVLVSVRGGTDVGFDESLLSGGTPFVGELQGTSASRYVTPLTTVAAKMAIENGVFSDQRYQQAVTSLTTALGLSHLDLAANPLDHLDNLKANSQVNQLVSRFSTTQDGYGQVMDELANLVKDGASLDLSSDTSTVVSLLNERLSVSSPDLALTPTSEAVTASALSSTNSEIEQSATIDEIETVVTHATEDSGFAFSIDNTAPLVRYSAHGVSNQYYTLFDFQDSVLHWGSHRAAFEGDWNETVEISAGAFSINQTLSDATVNVGLEFKSTSDARQLSVTLSGVKLSMSAGDSQSVAIKVPDGSVINARGVNRQGVITDVATLADEDQIASSEDGGFRFNLYDVSRRLRSNGHHSILSEAGNYEMTVVISGIRFSVATPAEEAAANEYSVTNGAESITGHGLRGYVTRVTGYY